MIIRSPKGSYFEAWLLQYKNIISLHTQRVKQALRGDLNFYAISISSDHLARCSRVDLRELFLLLIGIHRAINPDRDRDSLHTPVGVKTNLWESRGVRTAKWTWNVGIKGEENCRENGVDTKKRLISKMSGMIPGMEVYCVVTYGHDIRDWTQPEELRSARAQDFDGPSV